MKKLIITGLAVFSFVLVQAQNVTELDEVELGFTHLNTEVSENGNSLTFNLEGDRSNDIIHKPLKFIKDNFNLKNLTAYFSENGYDGFEVQINSSKGSLKAEYDREGNLEKTVQNFRNVTPSREVMREFYTNYKGWEITKNKYFASSEGEIINKEWYKMKLRKGNERQTIKIDGRNIGESVASNLSLN